jgi:hypothetical protein
MSKKKKTEKHGKARNQKDAVKNKPIHIPLSFEKAVVGLMKVKPKKDQGQEPS